jgi:hypothetical protein
MHRDAVHLTITEKQAEVLTELLNYSGCTADLEGMTIEDFVQGRLGDTVDVESAMYSVYTQLSRILEA